MENFYNPKKNYAMMLWQLVNFKIKTTFRRSVIMFYIAELVFFAFISYFLSISHLPFALYILDIIGILFLSMTFILNGVYSSFFIQKPDVDFLFMLPFGERELEIAYLLYTFLTNLLQTVIAAISLFPTITYFSLLVMLVSSVINSFAFFAFKRKVIVLVIGVWMLSSLLKFPFSPFSMVFGYSYGYFILSALLIITVFLGIRNTSVEDLILEFYKRQGLITPTGKTTTSLSLYSSSPFIAMLKRSFNFFETVGRVNLSGIPHITSRRVKIYKVLLITVAVGVVNYVVVSLMKSQLSYTFFIESNIGLFAGITIVSLTSNSAFANEPLWLNLSVMTPIDYARKYLLAKTLSLFILFLPISISIILLNHVAGIGSLFVPLVYIYEASINARVNPVSSQILSGRALSSSILLYPSALVIFFRFLLHNRWYCSNSSFSFALLVL